MSVKVNPLRMLTLLFFLLFVYKVSSYPLSDIEHETILPTTYVKIEKNNVLINLNKRDKEESENKVKYSGEEKKTPEKEKWEKFDNNSTFSPSKTDDYGSDDIIPTNTVVTTIVIISTQSASTIYGNSNNKPFKQKNNESNTDISDINSNTYPKKFKKDMTKYKKLVIALSVVGSVAGIVVIAAVVVLTRMKLRQIKKKKQQPLDDKKAISNNDSSSSPPSTPPASDSTDNATPTANVQLVPVPNEEMTTPNEHPENPFDPIIKVDDFDLNNTYKPTSPQLNIHYYSSYRQNRTLSVSSQMTANITPSAPTAKELEASNYDTPCGEVAKIPADESCSTSAHPPSTDPFVGPSVINIPETLRRSASGFLMGPSQESHILFDLPPPPAYTPSAVPDSIPETVPSAPPLDTLSADEQQSIPTGYSTLHSTSITSSASTNSTSENLAHVAYPFHRIISP